MVRMLTRYRRRFEFAWRPATAIATVLLALLFAGSVSTGDRASAVASSSATSWLERAQNEDGGFGFAPGEQSNPGMTGWAVLGSRPPGQPARPRSRRCRSDLLSRGDRRRITTTGDIERTISFFAAPASTRAGSLDTTSCGACSPGGAGTVPGAAR